MGALYDFLADNGEVYLNEHFIYASWMHGDGYVNNRILGEEQFTAELRNFSLELLGKTITEANIDLNKPVLVIGIKTLGAKMAKVAVEAYNQTHDTHLRFATIGYDKNSDGTKTYYWDSDNPSISHLCTLETQVIWMDDLLNLSSTLENTRCIFEERSPISAVAVLFDRSEFSAADIKVPALVSLEKHPMKAYDPGTCPMCRKNQAIVADFGRGADYQSQKPAYPGGYKNIKETV